MAALGSADAACDQARCTCWLSAMVCLLAMDSMMKSNLSQLAVVAVCRQNGQGLRQRML